MNGQPPEGDTIKPLDWCTLRLTVHSPGSNPRKKFTGTEPGERSTSGYTHTNFIHSSSFYEIPVHHQHHLPDEVLLHFTDGHQIVHRLPHYPKCMLGLVAGFGVTLWLGYSISMQCAVITMANFERP